MAVLLDSAEIGERLKATRKALGFNATVFSRSAGIAQNAYSQYESGVRRLTLVQALKLCNKHGLTLDWLYRGDLSGLPQQLVLKLSPAPVRLVKTRR
jgi:transcriptional regulator with XRE-family HTH domain